MLARTVSAAQENGTARNRNANRLQNRESRLNFRSREGLNRERMNMTSDEIRALIAKPTKNLKEEGELGMKLVAEIAAQLAELNHRMECMLDVQTRGLKE
jgi:hypothetical protein